MHYQHPHAQPRPSLEIPPSSTNDNASGGVPRLSVEQNGNTISAPSSRPASRGTDEAALTLRIPSSRLSLDIWTGDRARPRHDSAADAGGEPFDVNFTHNEIVLRVVRTITPCGVNQKVES